jgi:hypothetical protein
MAGGVVGYLASSYRAGRSDRGAARGHVPVGRRAPVDGSSLAVPGAFAGHSGAKPALRASPMW